MWSTWKKFWWKIFGSFRKLVCLASTMVGATVFPSLLFHEIEHRAPEFCLFYIWYKSLSLCVSNTKVVVSKSYNTIVTVMILTSIPLNKIERIWGSEKSLCVNISIVIRDQTNNWAYMCNTQNGIKPSMKNWCKHKERHVMGGHGHCSANVNTPI